jgi:hypothetical protein
MKTDLYEANRIFAAGTCRQHEEIKKRMSVEIFKEDDLDILANATIEWKRPTRYIQ